MCGHGSLPSPPSSDDGSYDSDASEGSDEPRLTPQELGALFVDFYSFMTTLTYDKSDLKIPPPTGCPEITPESCVYIKSDYAVEVIHLPYFVNKSTTQFHYRSKLLDLRAWTPEDFKRHHEIHDCYEFWSSEDVQDHSDVVCIAEGYGTGGRVLWLLVKDCEIIEHINKADMMSEVKVEDFFSNLRDWYENLKLIPGKGRVTIEAEKVPEREQRITEDEVNSQTERWGTDLDVQYVRQIYRDHGWPHSFNFEAASRAVNTWLEPLGLDSEGPRGFAWQRVDFDLRDRSNYGKPNGRLGTYFYIFSSSSINRPKQIEVCATPDILPYMPPDTTIQPDPNRSDPNRSDPFMSANLSQQC